MSKLSSIFKGFESSLRVGQQRNEDLYRQHQEVIQELYECQLKQLIKPWKPEFSSSVKLIRLHDQIRDFFCRDEIHFVAIDGVSSCLQSLKKTKVNQ